MKKSVFLGTLAASALLAGFASAGTLDDVKARGQLICGSNTGLTGFGAPDASGNYAGFDVDLCKAIAAAVLGDSSKVKYVPTTGETRFTALASGEVDVLVRNSTWTFSRDTDLKLQGPVVAELQKTFLAAWAAQHGPPLAPRNWFPPPEVAGRQVVRAIASSPEDAYSLIYATLLSAIGNAETSVLLTNAYFAPGPQLLNVLEAAAGRGVRVQLILPSHTDSWLVFHTGRSHYERLLKAGVRISERMGRLPPVRSASGPFRKTAQP